MFIGFCKLFLNIVGQYDAALHVPHLQQARTTNFMTITAMEGTHPDAYKFLEDSYKQPYPVSARSGRIPKVTI